MMRMPAGDGEMNDEHRGEMLRKHHHNTQWVYWMVILLGVWLMVGPASFDYDRGLVAPAGGREVWLDLSWRIWALRCSDLVSGALLVILGLRALAPGRPFALWGACLVGVWLNVAPLVFWSPSAAVYLNDTLVGVLVIALTVLIPGMPNMICFMKMGPDKPPGWSYNPASWPQRGVMIALAFAGWLVSRHLAMYQLGYLGVPWEPFFGLSSARVLTSDVSHALPVSDAGLGALAYTFEFLMGWMGGTERWRTMPWMVTFFGILVIPLGLVHIFLVASQPIAVGHWCTLCLLAAAIMLPMIPLEADEVIAMCQFMAKARREGKPLWRTFWKGDIVEGVEPETGQPEIDELPRRPGAVIAAGWRGVSFPWTLLALTALGVWLMAAPDVLGTTGRLADVEHGGGALLVTVAVVAMGEPLRVLRLLIVPLGAALVVCAWVLGGGDTPARVLDTAVGALSVALALPRGPKHETYGSWDRFVR